MGARICFVRFRKSSPTSLGRRKVGVTTEIRRIETTECSRFTAWHFCWRGREGLPPPFALIYHPAWYRTFVATGHDADGHPCQDSLVPDATSPADCQVP